MCVSMSDKPFHAEACDIDGHASATKGLSDMKTHIENAPCNRPLRVLIILQTQITTACEPHCAINRTQNRTSIRTKNRTSIRTQNCTCRQTPSRFFWFAPNTVAQRRKLPMNRHECNISPRVWLNYNDRKRNIPGAERFRDNNALSSDCDV
jgi:hypothetical protein